MMVPSPRLRERQAGGSSAATTTSYIVESRDFETRRQQQQEEGEDYDADRSDDRTSSTGSRGSSGRRSDDNDDYGVELVLNQTTDSQRARDMIVSSRRRKSSSPSPYKDTTSSGSKSKSSKSRSKREAIQVETVDSHSVGSTTADSRASSKNSQRPRHAIDTAAAASVQSTRSQQSHRSRFMREPASDATASERSLFDEASETSSTASGNGALIHPLKEGDTIWRAAKRGDLTALKRFHGQGKVDWAATDQFGNTPLFYACHSGAIVDINVVHFLLWVTAVQEVDLESCKNRKNKDVMKILNEFEGNGYTSPFESGTEGRREKSVDRQKSSRPPRPQSSTKNSRVCDIETSSISTRSTTKPVVRDKALQSLVGTRSTTKSRDRPVVRDKALQSLVEDVNKIHVSPSNVTNMTIDTDDWSLGSMLSFGKRLKRRSGNNGNSGNKSNSFYDEASIGSRSSRTGSTRMKESSLRRKVSFDDKSSKKKPESHGFRRSPSEKVSYGDNKDAGFPPRVEYEEKSHQWTIENHIATEDAASSNIVLTIHVFDSNQTVVIRNCHGVSVDIHGKTMKSGLIVDSSDLNVVFDSVSDACNIVHSKNIAVETTGICRNFSMDRTKGINIWLSRESRDVSKIVTSKCTDVSVLLPTNDSETDYERRELTLPEKYTHQFTGGRMKSRVSSVA